MLRSWRNNDPPPPLPSLPPVPPIPARAASAIKIAPPSPSSSMFSTQTAPVGRFPGPGICSTMPPPFNAPENSTLSPTSPARRFYRGPVPAASTPALGEYRGPISISAPIPGVGDVPAHYRFRGDGADPRDAQHPSPPQSGQKAQQQVNQTQNKSQQVQPASQMKSDQQQQQPPAEITRSLHRQSTQTVRGTSDTRAAESNLVTSSLGPSQRTRLASLGFSKSPLSTGNHARAPPRPHREASVNNSPVDSRKGETEYIADAEVAALVTDAHIPPMSPVSVRSKLSMVSQAAGHRHRDSISSVQSSAYTLAESSTSPPGAWPSASTAPGAPVGTASSSGPAIPLTGSFVTYNDNGRPSSLLSSASWASIGPASKTRPSIVSRSTGPGADASASDKIEALQESPKAFSSSLASLTNSAAIAAAFSAPEPSTTTSVQASPVQKTRPLSLRPKSGYSTSAFGPGHHSPTSSYSSHAGGPLAELINDSQVLSGYTPAHTTRAGSPDGSQTTSSTTASSLAPSPSPAVRSASTRREIASLRDRNNNLEVTNARLTAELGRVRSEVSLRSSFQSGANTPNSFMINDGEFKKSSLLPPGGVDVAANSARASYRASSLTVRDERSSRRASAISRLTAQPGTYDLSVPTLLAEIDSLRRNSERLQAELHAVRSQVNLLFPPTPAEMAEKEALERLCSSPETSLAGTPDVSPAKAHKRLSRASHISVSAASAPPMPGHPDTERESTESAASTPSSSASETWPITPVMNIDWSPSPANADMNGSATTKIKLPAMMSMTPLSDARSYPSPGMVNLNRLQRPSSGMTDTTPPPRPPRAARRGDSTSPSLPPGAEAAKPAPRARASTLTFAM